MVKLRRKEENEQGILENSTLTGRKGTGFRASVHGFEIPVPLIQPWDFR